MKFNENSGAKRRVYNSCDPQYLRESREAAGMDIVVLARTACLSIAQVRQLEGGGGGLFYSEAIKSQAYKRLLMILGAEAPTVDVSDELRDAGSIAETPSKDLTQRTSPQAFINRPVLSPARAGLAQVKMPQQVLGVLSLLALAGVLYFLYDPTDSEPAVPEAQTPLPMQQAEVPPESLEPPSSSAVTTAFASTSAVRHADACAHSGEPMSELTSSIAKKEGRYVYLVGLENVEICVVDGNKQATIVQLNAHEDRSVYGVSPWQVSGSNLQKVQIYFQGGRVSLPNTQVNRVQLVEVPVVR